MARLLGPHAADAEDVLQESWIRGLDALHQYRGEGFVTWMTRIALRCALDFLRRRDTRTALRSLDDARTIPDASGDPDLSQDLERGLAQLSPHARMTVVMHDIEGFTHQEIAQTLGIAVGTSKAHLFQARRKLRGWLDAHSSEENTA